MINFIESSLQETPTTEKIISLDMPPQATFVTFRSSSSRLDQEEVQYLVTESIKKKELIPILAGEDKVVNTKVNVRIMDIRWMLRGGIGFLDFVTILSNYRRDKLFRTDLLRSLTHEYWIIYQRQIILRALLPWIVFSFMSILYFSNLSVGSESPGMRICALLIVISVGFQVYVEVKQIMGDWRDYVEDYYNINDLFQYCATLWVVLATMFGSYDSGNMVAIRNLCCFILLSQGVKAVIDWLRLFDTTSFYVTLILRTVTDIGYFVLIIGVMITYTGCATYMLQLNS